MTVRRDAWVVEVEMTQHLTPMLGTRIEMSPRIGIQGEGPGAGPA